METTNKTAYRLKREFKQSGDRQAFHRALIQRENQLIDAQIDQLKQRIAELESSLEG